MLTDLPGRADEAVGAPAPDPATVSPRQVWFVYNRPLNFSGQSGATELIVEGLRARGWSCRMVHFPALNRGISSRAARVAQYAFGVLAASLRLLLITLRRRIVLHVSIGQSLASFFRVGPALVALSLLRPRLPRVISLHGSVFMTWDANQLEARVFRLLLRRMDIITVLSARQQRHLAALGVEASRVVVLPNTCEMPPCSDSDLERKWYTSSRHRPLRLLHLSLLIESKGYPEYLEALELLAQRGAGPIEAVLCGPLSFSAYCHRFPTPAIKEAWIRNKIDAINAFGCVRVRWIEGAAGVAKHVLFREAAVFVFPSQFPVEAQPLVLLEAMASGCAIVTSTVGEISSTLDDQSAIFLTKPTSTNVATAIDELIADRDAAARLARTARDRYASTFDRDRYTDLWAATFSSLVNRPQESR